MAKFQEVGQEELLAFCLNPERTKQKEEGLSKSINCLNFRPFVMVTLRLCFVSFKGLTVDCSSCILSYIPLRSYSSLSILSSSSQSKDYRSILCLWTQFKIFSWTSGCSKQASISYLRLIDQDYKMQFKNIFKKKEEEEESSCPRLTFVERIIGFGICCVLGFVLQILSFGAILSFATGDPTKFAIIYSFGSILTLAATGFLIGFRRQIKNMVDLDRRIASIIFVGALIGTLVSVLVFSSKLLVIIFLAIQIPAYIWYCASYIPYARSCLKSCLKKCFKKQITEQQS